MDSLPFTQEKESGVSLLHPLQEALQGRIPKHIAIIMDGNRRWAKEKGLPLFYGHWHGADVIMDIVKFAAELGVETLTLYAFSTENWTRPHKEVKELMRLVAFYLRKKKKVMIEESVKLETIGDLSKLPVDVQERLKETKEATALSSKIRLVLALNYGGRDEIRRAVVKIAEDLEQKKIVKEHISEALIGSYLDTASFGDPDLFIRTSGEQRLSNFLLWQMSYAEVYLTKVLWPDFDRRELLRAILEFQKRERRRGE
ncbi:MAG: isoprenyl transferase [Chlamydiae bacterium]|nr:isoprenyl transferase [Chlamydiota bacterium]